MQYQEEIRLANEALVMLLLCTLKLSVSIPQYELNSEVWVLCLMCGKTALHCS